MNTHLMLNRAAGDEIALGWISVCIEFKFGDDKERDTFDAFRRAFDTRKAEVNDIIRHIMLTRRDENLLARDFIGPIRIWHRLGFQ